MSLRQTSMEAYQRICDDGTVSRQESIVLQCLISNGDLTDKEIKAKTGMEINAVTGRRNGLFKKGIVEKKGFRHQASGKRAIVWGLSGTEKPKLNYQIVDCQKCLGIARKRPALCEGFEIIECTENGCGKKFTLKK